MWNGNEDEEKLKEGFEKSEMIENIRGEGRDGIATKIMRKQ